MKKSKPLTQIVKIVIIISIVVAVAGCDLLMVDILKESIDEQTQTVSVTYHPNGATSGECPQDDNSYRADDTAVIADNSGNLGISGYTFTGWNSQADGSGQDYFPADEVQLSNTNLHLYAQWQAEEHSISFDANGGSGSMDLLSVFTDEEITLPPNTFTREGYTFNGWTTSSTGSPILSDEAPYSMGTYDITLFASWIGDTDTPYTVEHYQQNIHDDSYSVAETENLTGQTDTIATAAVKDYTGFSENTSHTDRVPSGTITADGSLVLKLFYDRETYTVGFESNGGSSVNDKTGVRYGAKISEPSISREGYTFAGWHADSGLTEAWSFSSDTVTAATTLYAKWSADAHTLSFHPNGGIGTMSSLGLDTDQVTTLLSNSFTKDGYHFIGWTDLSSGSVVFADEASYTMGTTDSDLYAKWAPNGDTPYTVEHYQQNIGKDSYTLAEIENFTGQTDSTATAAVKGYTGFRENTSHTDRVPSGTITADGSLVLKLFYDRETYTIRFESNGGSGTMSSLSLVTDQEITLLVNTYTRAGYTFNGWAESSTGSVVYGDQGSYSMGNTDAVLYAKWSPNGDTPYTVEHYQQNLSDNTYTLAETEDLTGQTDSTATATVKAYTGFRENTSHAERVPSETITADGSLILKLFYDRETYTVSFDSNGGRSISDITRVNHGATISEPSVTRDGYIFGGWYENSDLSSLWDFTTRGVTGDITLYAKWDKKTHILRFNANDGNGTMDPLTVAEYDRITLPANTFTREGYSFSGWATASWAPVLYTDKDSYYMTNIDVELYAKWNPNFLTREELQTMINNGEDVTQVDTSGITDMSYLFKNSAFNQDISKWDVSNVTNMQGMFYSNSAFNQDISNWDVSNVTNMSSMFSWALAFNQDISGWDVSSVTNMHGMFTNATSFNKNLSNWDVGSVTDMSRMFSQESSFNGNISSWDVSNVTDMSSMFFRASSFNQNISNWDVSNVTNMQSMYFEAVVFNQDISGWDVSNVTNMQAMFYNASAFNQDISNWDVSNVTNMSNMFSGASTFNQDISGWLVYNVTNMASMFKSTSSFNQDLSDWDVSNVTNMAFMFSRNSSFNQDLSRWNVSNVTNMASMFSRSSFNKSIFNWDVSNVTNMSGMFSWSSVFNQDLSSWNVSKVSDMSNMFWGATSFNQDISSWNVSNVTDMGSMFNVASSFNQDISGWDVKNVREYENFSGDSCPLITEYHPDPSWDN